MCSNVSGTTVADCEQSVNSKKKALTCEQFHITTVGQMLVEHTVLSVGTLLGTSS